MIDVIINILIYLFFAFVMNWMARQSQLGVETGEYSASRLDPWLWAFILFFTFVMGTRWMVGSDNVSYILQFKNGIEGKNNEDLWKWFVDSIYFNRIHWVVGMLIIAFAQIFFVVEALKRYRYILVFLPFVLFGCRYWADYAGACRQMIAASMFLWSIRFIVKRQYIYYLIVIYTGSLIHHSVLMLLPFIILPRKISLFKGNRWILMGIYLVCVALGYFRKTAFLQAILSPIIGESIYSESSVGAGMNTALAEGSSEVLTFGPMMIAAILLGALIIWYYPQLKEKLSPYIPEFDIWFLLSYFYGCFYFLVCNLGHLFIRPTQYFEVFQMVMASLLFYYMWSEYKLWGRKAQLVLYSIIIASSTTWNVYKNMGQVNETTTYKSMFFQEVDMNRFGL